ncbi:hypothetical protein BDFB_003336 [Asbolus verrucosus]|uniref:Uncharacterized protein n=1 Tax=Asbolus verrucosus TaxID=1661398 RepID=A0A482WBM0_ASBVE|nr:hypothetical protein BDFB_003336 [Asbolus verrucosus]
MGRLLLRCLTHPTLRHPLPGALRPRPYPRPCHPTIAPRFPTPTTPPGPQPPFAAVPDLTLLYTQPNMRDIGERTEFRRPRFLHSQILSKQPG